MQGIYTDIPETNYVPREYSVAAILLLLFMVFISLVPVLNILYFYISTFRSMCAVPNMAVFWGSLTSWFPGVLLTYFLNDFEIVPVAPIITGITFVFTFYVRCLLLLLIIIIICFWRNSPPVGQDLIHEVSRSVFLNRRAAARYRALASIIPSRERFSWNLSF